MFKETSKTFAPCISSPCTNPSDEIPRNLNFGWCLTAAFGVIFTRDSRGNVAERVGARNHERCSCSVAGVSSDVASMYNSKFKEYSPAFDGQKGVVMRRRGD